MNINFDFSRVVTKISIYQKLEQPFSCQKVTLKFVFVTISSLMPYLKLFQLGKSTFGWFLTVMTALGKSKFLIAD